MDFIKKENDEGQNPEMTMECSLAQECEEGSEDSFLNIKMLLLKEKYLD